MATVWSCEYEGNKIEVKNFADRTQLCVNDELQDEVKCIMSFSPIRLTGKLPSGEEIKATMGDDILTFKCSVFVSNKKMKVTKTKKNIKKME